MNSKEKHIPLRMCVACRQMYPQNELIRIVCNDGNVETDVNKKKFGRGAYICKNAQCIEKAEKKNLLAKHFRMKVGQEIYKSCGEILFR